MTKSKDLKRRVRARMQRTGESYTTARAVLLNKKAPETKPALPAVGPPKDWPEVAGVREEAVVAKTEHTWVEWVDILDAAGAYEMRHRDIAAYLNAQHGDMGSWWAQTVTVGYERIRGLRRMSQGRDGQYAANKSRTYPVSVSKLYAMFTPKARSAWMEDAVVKDRTAKKDTSRRVDWHDGTRVHFFFDAKGPSKSTVSIQHVKLESRDDVEARKAFWHEQLDALKRTLG